MCAQLQNLDGVTALFSAILSQNVQSVKLLLDGGADPSSISNIDSEEVTPLHHAAKHGFTGYSMAKVYNIILCVS